MIPANPSLMCSFNRRNVEGTNSLKICVCMFCFMFVLGLLLWIDLRKSSCVRSVHLLMTAVCDAQIFD